MYTWKYPSFMEVLPIGCMTWTFGGRLMLGKDSNNAPNKGMFKKYNKSWCDVNLHHMFFFLMFGDDYRWL